MPLVNKSLSEELGKVFKYPVTVSQSLRAFFKEMDTYGKINQKTIFDSLVVLSQFVDDINKSDVSNKPDIDLLKRIENLETNLNSLRDQLKEVKVKLSQKPPVSK